ncbi:hypothetical protein IE4872_PC00153 (plasmid) [Rhizobium gallicum]|uniref:Uncharacterized protein n=1 Tax=Rhizobium gallicum TaxID=56730 RepID=A0A1L5NQM9_9HYPH|nr:hypothetical protein IE4872_PC00153 [Rhizobium gallicum]
MSDNVVHRTGQSDTTCCTPDERDVLLTHLDAADAGGARLDREPGAIFGGAAMLAVAPDGVNGQKTLREIAVREMQRQRFESGLAGALGGGREIAFDASAIIMKRNPPSRETPLSQLPMPSCDHCRLYIGQSHGRPAGRSRTNKIDYCCNKHNDHQADQLTDFPLFDGPPAFCSFAYNLSTTRL